jgi:hypothetical protein
MSRPWNGTGRDASNGFPLHFLSQIRRLEANLFRQMMGKITVGYAPQENDFAFAVASEIKSLSCLLTLPQ